MIIVCYRLLCELRLQTRSKNRKKKRLSPFVGAKSHSSHVGRLMLSLHTATITLAIFSVRGQQPNGKVTSACSLQVHSAVSLWEYTFPKYRIKIQLTVPNLRKHKTYCFPFMEYVLAWVIDEFGPFESGSPKNRY